MKHKRHLGRGAAELRPAAIETGYVKYPEGSALITMGETRVLCNASVEEQVPPWLKGKGRGWVTAEYGMLPRATHERTAREAKKGLSGRSQEISRLVGRALRAAVELEKLGERQITVDCDVLQADAGTRCAAITGGYVALALAVKNLLKKKILRKNPLVVPVVAVSCGIKKGVPVLDLDYEEDSSAEVDMNFVMTGDLKFVEVQGTAEGEPFSFADLEALKDLALAGAKKLLALQRKALS